MLSMSGKDFGSPFQALSQASSVGNIKCCKIATKKKTCLFPGLTTACGPSQCKKVFLLILSILATLFNLGAFAPLVLSFTDLDGYYSSRNCPEFNQRSSYLLIQMGLVFFLSATTFSLSILSCLYKPALKTNQGKLSFLLKQVTNIKGNVKTLPKALRTQALTALTSNFG